MQLRLMRELVRTEPEAAVVRFESNRYASNEAVIKVRQRPLLRTRTAARFFTRGWRGPDEYGAAGARERARVCVRAACRSIWARWQSWAGWRGPTLPVWHARLAPRGPPRRVQERDLAQLGWPQGKAVLAASAGLGPHGSPSRW